MNLLLHGVEDFKIVREDTLRNPAFFDGDHLAQFDCVIANPPFSLKNWGDDEWAADKWGRNQLGGVPPKGYARLGLGPAHAHLVRRRRPAASPSSCRRVRCSGRAPRARSASTSSRPTSIEAVIGLAPNLFYGTGLAACVLDPARARSRPTRKGKVLVHRRVERCSSGPQPEHPGARARRADPRRRTRRSPTSTAAPRVVDLDEIESNDYNLNIPLLRRPRRHRREGHACAEALADLEAAHAEAAGSRGPRCASELAEVGAGCA